MPITLSKPKAIVNPEIPYDRLAVSLQIFPIFRDTGITASVQLRAEPYRVLPDKTLDRVGAQGAIMFQFSDVYAEATEQAQSGDLALATALQKIEAAIQEYVKVKLK